MIPVSSLSARLLISVSLLLVFFFGVTIIVLDAAFRETGEQAQEDILGGQVDGAPCCGRTELAR